MRLLYLIFVLSVAALIWTAFAIARHIRRQGARQEPRLDSPAGSLEATTAGLPGASEQSALNGFKTGRG